MFSDTMLRPELQGMADYVDGINNIVEAQRKVALSYFEDGSIEAAILPLKILLHIMAYGHYEGKAISDPSLRNCFSREYVIESHWYKARLRWKQQRELNFLQKQLSELELFLNEPKNSSLVADLDIHGRIESVKKSLLKVNGKEYMQELVGTIGLDPLYQMKR